MSLLGTDQSYRSAVVPVQTALLTSVPMFLRSTASLIILSRALTQPFVSLLSFIPFVVVLSCGSGTSPLSQNRLTLLFSSIVPTTRSSVMSRPTNDRLSPLLAVSNFTSHNVDLEETTVSASASTHSSPSRSSLLRRSVLSFVIYVAVTVLLIATIATLFQYFGRSPSNPLPSTTAIVSSLPQGAIQGVVADTCVTYYSIPFAQPPVGPLRWLPPQQPPPSWSDVRDGTQPPPMCAQPGGDGVAGQEDCLYLNVYTNTAWADQDPLPVMMYIHGGSSIGGYSASGFNDHCDLVRSRPIVAVTVNYRLNVFGYLALDLLSQRQANYTRSGRPTSGNWGLRDNVAALEWIRDNIGHFGGDPSAVTIYGQSTGGTNVMALYISPLAVGLFRSALSLSGSPVMKGSLSEAEAQNEEFIANANCSRTTSDATVDCLLALTAAEAWAAVPTSWLGSYDFGIQNRSSPDAMVIAVDGEVVVADINTSLNKGVGSAANVTLAYGHMGQEVDLGPMANVTGYSQAEWEQWLSDNLPALGWNETVVSALKAAYPIADYDDEAQLTYEMVVNDITYCGGVNNLRALSARSSPPSPPIYHHLNDFAPVLPVTYLNPGWPTRYAGHVWDQLLLLRQWPAGYEGDSTHWGGEHGDELRSETLRRLWVDGLVRGGGDRSNGSLWTEFNAQWTDGRAATTYTAHFGRVGEVDVLADVRWDKCVLLDSLGFGDAGWAN